MTHTDTNTPNHGWATAAVIVVIGIIAMLVSMLIAALFGVTNVETLMTIGYGAIALVVAGAIRLKVLDR